jgi:formamidopyrimidine-DNA glycosylase
MPELPEVETTRRGLMRAINGHKIVEVDVKRRDLRTKLPDDFEARLEGRSITGIRRRAKYLLIDLDSNDVVLAHLGMSGSFRVVNATDYLAKKHDHILWHMEDGKLAVFHDPRRFGLMDVFARKYEKTHPLLAHLGPEPLSGNFTPHYLQTQLLRRSGPIKPALIDQKLVVGVGNIYASESLFRCGVNPQVSAKKAASSSAEIVAAIKATLEDALNSGGSTLRDFVGADGEGGYFQHRFLVYEREDYPCSVCKESIKITTQAGRSTYWCDTCQPLHAISKKPRRTAGLRRIKKNHAACE